MTHAEYLAYEARGLPKRFGQMEETSAQSKSDERESKLHNAILAECKARGWYVVHARMDVATTTALGTPDFIIAANNVEGPRTYWIECKSKSGKRTVAQNATAAWLTKLGHRYALIRTLREFYDVVGPF